MYFPPYKQLLHKIELATGTPATQETVLVPRSIFDFLLQTSLMACEFDEKRYLSENSDVATGPVRAGQITAKQHFVNYGYFEGRRGYLPKVDEKWYQTKYEDVALALQNGSVPSVSEHFEGAGAIEGRAPTKNHLGIATQWKKLLEPDAGE